MSSATTRRRALADAVPFDPATVSLEPGISLVEASAGTGKTFSITQLVLRLLLDRRPDGKYRVRGIGSILVVTFTNAATDELITRVRAALREATDVFTGVVTERSEKNESLFALRSQYGVSETPRLREALASLDQLAIFTIHGFCKRVLEESALESGTPFNARFIEDDALLIERIAQDWWRRTMYEDAELAHLAVHRGWSHDAYLKDLGKWQRLPKTVIDPDLDLAATRRKLTSAVKKFARVWDHESARAFLNGLPWRANAPLLDAGARAQVLKAGDALATGNLAGGMRLVEQCTTAAIRDDKTGIKIKPADKFASVDDQPFVAACDAIDALLGDTELALRVSCLRDVRHRFDDEKRRRHLLGFDDLLRRLDAALDAGGQDGHLASAIRACYDAALIDEFQDTDPFQFPIFRTAFAGRPLFLIGDPKQAIFAFRGADLFAYMDAASKAERTYTLGSNWRSTDRLVSAVNALFQHRPSAFLYADIGFAPATAATERADPLLADGQGALRWWLMPPEQDKPLGKGEAERRVERALTREVVALLTPTTGRAALRPGQIAVLVRSGYEGIATQRALRRVGVPCIVSGLADILHSRELLDLEWVLRAVLAAGDARGVRAALSTELWGMDAAAIHRLSLPEHEREWEAIIDRLVAWRDEWTRFGFMRMVQTMLGALRASERLLSFEDGERRLTNLRHAVELLHTVTSEERLSPEGLLLWIARTRATGEEKAERTELRLESDADAVQIATIHKSKGLEYDVVFCPSLWTTRRTTADEPVLVHLDDRSVVFDHGSRDREARGRLAAAEELAEELRLLYVALTRARLRCYVAWGAVTNSGTRINSGHTALGYLLRSATHTGSPEELARSVPAAFDGELAQFGESLRALVAASAGAMTIEILAAEAEPAPSWAGAGLARVAPVHRTDLPTPATLCSWRISSFTSLTAGHQTDDPRDLSDTGAEQPVRGPTLDPADFLAFPAGRHAGVALHELFERIDFAAPAADVRASATDILHRARLGEPVERVTAVVSMAERVLCSLLPEQSFALRDIPRARTLREWQFHLPLGTVDRGTLAGLFAAHGGDLAQRYVPALRQLSPEGCDGFLTGVVDLAFERDGRWYVLDWKSNHLGYEPALYERDALEREMFGSHYVLQYHLYITALHRFLRRRVPDYDYERCIGGAWYAFLRGIDGSARGWFHDRPPRALIDALDALMDGVPTGAARETRV